MVVNPTRNTDVTTASVELLTEAGATLLLRCSIDMDVIWPVLQVLSYHSKARAIILPGPKHSSLGPVGPENVLLEDSHGKWVLDSMHYHLPILTGQSGPLNLVTKKENKGKINNI